LANRNYVKDTNENAIDNMAKGIIQVTMEKKIPDKSCGICGKGSMKFLISLKETYKDIDNFDCQVIVIRQCNTCREVDYDMNYIPVPSKV
jgi:hypothetical protein